MSRRVNACVASLGVTALMLAGAGGAFAASGGGPSGGASGGGGNSGGVGVSPGSQTSLGLAASNLFIGGTIGIVSPGNVTVSATQGGITIEASASTMLHGALRISGQAPTGDAGETIEIERLGHETEWGWAQTAEATIGPNGSFTATWDTDHIGRFEIGAVLGGSQSTPASGPTVLVTVFRPSIATWYEPTFRGAHTACGERLTRKTFGVANRTLPCGERVAVYYNGRTIVVPVIDRGPYGDGAQWDLTEATARVLGMLETGRASVGAVSLPRKP